MTPQSPLPSELAGFGTSAEAAAAAAELAGGDSTFGSHDLETRPPSEPASDEPVGAGENGAGSPSPSAVEQHEAMLTVEWAKLSERFAQLKADEIAVAIERRNALNLAAESKKKIVAERLQIGDEMERVRRLLAAHKRLKNPVRRKVAK
jgi:hypothetical protein